MADTCKKCGNNLYGNKVNCPFCGEPIKGSRTSSSSSYNNYNRASSNNNNNSNNSYQGNQQYRPQRRNNDEGGFGWGLLGFCVPLVGIILYFVWRDERPFTAKACLNGALISIAISVFFNIVAGCGAAM